MPPRNQSLLCVCLVLTVVLGWTLLQPPAIDSQESPRAATATQGTARPTSPAASIALLPVSTETPPVLAGAAAGEAPAACAGQAVVAPAPLPADFLRRILSEDEKSVIIALPDGSRVSGTVSLLRRDRDGLLLVQGTVTDPEAGHFMFQRQTIPGKAGALVGFIYYDHAATAWQVRPDGENGAPALVKTTVDAVICRAYAAPPPPADQEEIPATHPADYPIPPDENGIIQLQSLPGAAAVIYLDFDGEERNFDGWGPIDAAPSGASNAEIFEVWQGVCEDYQPFQINVTTVRAVYEAALPGHRMQVVITPTDTARPGAGGVAIIGSFNWTGDMVCWSFSTTGKNAVEVISHEVGHTLGLSHDGRIAPFEEYYDGHNGWAPIMGVGYYQPLTQWSKGEYPGANNLQDDLQIISCCNNGVAYRADDHGASSATSSRLDITAAGAVSNEGIIETASDRDSFRFSTTGGEVDLQASPVGFANLDLKAELLSVTSTLITTIAVSDPSASLGASFTSLNLPAGDYLLRVSGTGNGNPATGYSDYGSLGSYTISGTVNGGVHADRFTIVENTATGSIVGTVAARADHDVGSPIFAITSGDPGGAFAIDPATGQITVADESLLDHEALSTRWDDPAVFELLVSITDDLDFATEIIHVVIDVTNVNEPPDFAPPPAVTIPETLPAGMVVARVSASDPDQGDFLAYSIVAGNEGGHFAIDSATGVVTVAAPLDYQAVPVHQLTLRATDHLEPANEVDVPLVVSLVDVFPDVVSGGLVRTFYSGIEGSAVADLTGNPRFPDKPGSETVLESFDSGANQGTDYGSTLRGYLIAPFTGEYTFWICADDAGELLVSSDSDPANAVPCASVTGPVAPGEWTSQPGQQSAAIELTAGGVYYIEARHKQGAGGDFVQVAWQGPGMAEREIIPGTWLAPYHQQHAPWAPDLAASVRESAPAGTLVCRVSQSFVEPNTGEEVAGYAITAGNEGGFFTMDPLNGEIRVATGAALIAGTPYVLTVSATDDGNPPATGAATVNISVTGLDENLFAWWKLDEISGSHVADSSGNLRDAWLAGGCSHIARSAANPALQLNGSDAHFERADYESLHGGQPFTVAAWVKVPVTHAAEGVLIQQTDPTGEFGPGRYDVSVTSDGRVRFSVYGWDADWSEAGSQFEITSPQAIHDGAWHHVACVRDGETGRLYIDGVERAAAVGSLRMLEFESTTAVGYDASSGGAFLDAAVDDVRIYAEALVSPQIVKVASIPVFTADPLAGEDAAEDEPYGGTLAPFANDPDAGDTLVFTKTGGPEWLAVAEDGVLSGTPGNADAGSNIFTVRVTDAAGAFTEAQLEITVLNVNDAPVFTADPIIGNEAVALAAYSGTLAGTAADPDAGDTLAFVKTDGPPWLIVNEDGTLSGTPAATDAGINLFVVSVTDSNGAGASATLQVTVHPPPVVSVLASVPTAAETGPETGAFTITRTGPADADLTVGLMIEGSALNGVDYAGIPASVLIPSGEESITLTVIPAADELIEGTETVVLTLTEGPYEPGQSFSALVSIRDSNHAPFFLASPVVSPAALVGAPYTGESLADHAGDPNLDDGDALSFEKTGGPDWLSIAPDGTLSGLPGELDLGNNLFTVRVTDAGGLTADGSLQITVEVPSPFESWQLAEFGPQAGEPLVAGESADPDQDGRSNLLEYALGTDPNLADVARIEQEMVDVEGTACMRLTYFINPTAEGITMVVEGTDDLTDPDGWSDGDLLIEELTTARLVVRDTVGGPRRFFRLRVSLP